MKDNTQRICEYLTELKIYEIWQWIFHDSHNCKGADPVAEEVRVCAIQAAKTKVDPQDFLAVYRVAARTIRSMQAEWQRVEREEHERCIGILDQLAMQR